jgi:hypothetical protein
VYRVYGDIFLPKFCLHSISGFKCPQETSLLISSDIPELCIQFNSVRAGSFTVKDPGTANANAATKSELSNPLLATA